MLSSSIIDLFRTLQAPEMQRLKPGLLLLLYVMLSYIPRLEEALRGVSICPAAAAL
jgi:hypothetical protein